MVGYGSETIGMFFGESRPVLPYFQHGVARRFLPWPPVAPRSATTLFALHACAISRIPSAKSLWDWSAGRPPTDLSISHGAAVGSLLVRVGACNGHTNLNGYTDFNGHTDFQRVQ